MKQAGKIALGAAAAAVGAAVSATVVKAAMYQPETREAKAFPEEKVDLDRYKQNLSDALKIPTISDRDPEKVDWRQFERFHAFLRERYPRIHQNLSLEIVGKASLMYFWQGADPSLDPIAMLAHQDVVPVTPGTESDWEHDPFGGEEADGFIWGRGALDIKNHLIGVMEAVETLLEEGFVPQRSVYILFGHNEETMERETSGATLMCQLLKERGVHLEAIIDEGGAILPVRVGKILNINLAGVGIAEKGYADFEISVDAVGGHSSQPPKHTALGKIACVIRDLENHQFKAELTPMMQELFDRIGRRVCFPAKLITCNLPLLKPLVLEIMKQIPPAACMTRTTTGVTMASGSPAPNVLPQRATVNVNFRIMPGETIADVEQHIRDVSSVKDIDIKLIKGKEPSAISPTDSKAFHAIEDLCFGMDQKNLVAPYLVMGGTDACNYEAVCENIYRYSPFMVNTSLLLTTHGTNERIPVSCMADGVAFFKRYIRAMCE